MRRACLVDRQSLGRRLRSVGDFEGFLLVTEGRQPRFDSREPEVEQIVARAWADRVLVAVAAERHDPHRIGSIMLLGPPMRRD